VVSQHAKRTVQSSAAFILPLLEKQHTKLLDVGCGPGSITIGFSPLCKQVEALDYSEAAVKMAQEASKVSCNVSRNCFIINVVQELKNVTIRQGSVYELPFEDNSFDVVYTHQVLQHLKYPIDALKEMKRVVKPGGFIGARDADYSSMLAYPNLRGIDEWRRIYRATCYKNDAEPDAGRYLLKWCMDSGFAEEQVKYTMSVVPYVTQAEREDWGLAWRTRALESDFAKQAVHYGLASREELQEISETWVEFTKAPGAVFYYVNGEVLAQKPAL